VSVSADREFRIVSPWNLAIYFHMKPILSSVVCVALVFMSAQLLSASDSPLLSAPKAAPGSGQPDLLVGLRKGGKFKGDGIYGAKLTPRQRLSRVPSSRGITNYFRIQNDSKGLVVEPYSLFKVSGNKSDGRFDIAYFSEKGGNVTARMTRGQYVLNIATDAETSLRQRVTPKSSASASGAVEVKAENVDTLRKDVAGVLLRRP
jgi:hypothetical protein